ncbi:SOQ1 [Symbiodinium natans]|uniref:SOQ1 protein n=2 Tax=Symbiodinium TaxID=2949 RepID=A0A812QLA5_9DINO|nr:SOQ1 [Symbiodinium natans]
MVVDSPRRYIFVATGQEVVVLSMGSARGIAAGLLGVEDVIGLPQGIAWSSTQERLVVSDLRGHVLRAVDVLDTGSVDIVAGTEGVGVDAGDNGPTVQASLQAPRGLALVGTAAFVSTGGDRIRRVDLAPGGSITTEVNSAGVRGVWGDGGPATQAELNAPQHVAVLQDKVFIADRNNQRVRLLNRGTGQISSAAGPLVVSTSGSKFEATYSITIDPNVTSASLPRDLVTTAPVGVTVSADGSLAIISDEHSESLLVLDLAVSPRRVRVLQGISMLKDPKDLLLAPNGTLFVADHQQHSIFAMELVCSEAVSVYSGGCIAQSVRRILGSGEGPGDGDTERRQPETSTLTSTLTSTSTYTSTLSELPCWNHILGPPGADCNETCARYEGVCDPNVVDGFTFEGFQSSVLAEERVTCQRDSRTWFGGALPGFETNRESRNFGWCLGTYGIPAEVSCTALYMEYGRASTTMRRWCRCSRESMCYMTTTTTVLQAHVPTSTTTRTWTGASTTFTRFSSTTWTSTVTATTLPATTSPSPYIQPCPEGYDRMPSPLPLASPVPQPSARACAVHCEVSSGCAAFAFDATTGLCGLASAPTGDWPVSVDPGSVHYTSCSRDPDQLDLLLQLLMADWLPAHAPLAEPGAMALDSTRQLLYFCDAGNHKIKVLDMGRNEVLTAAGIGESYTKFSGDGQPARDATMSRPRGLALDEANAHLYVTDSENHVIRRIKLGANRLTGIIESVAGTGVGGLGQDGLDPLLSRFNYPWGLAVEPVGGSVRLYVCDNANHQVSLIDLASSPPVVRKIAGLREAGAVPSEVGDGGPGLQAQVLRPQALALAGRVLLFAEPERERLRELHLDTDVIDTALETYAVNFSIGEGLAGIVPLDYAAGFSLPTGVAVQGDILYTASYGTGQVRQTNLTTGLTTDFAGRRNEGFLVASPGAGDGGPAPFAVLAGPVAVVAAGEVVYIAESDNGRIREVNLSTGIINTLPQSVPAAGQEPSLYGLSLDPLRQILYASSPSEYVVYRYHLEAGPCVAPQAVANAASPSCVEGEEVNLDHCTPVCVEGFLPTVSSLHCSDGVLTPPHFRCLPAPCYAPWGVEHAAQPPCAEGHLVASGSSCTSLCTGSYEPDANLTCLEGQLQPSSFQCSLPQTTTTVTASGSVVVQENASQSQASSSEVDRGTDAEVEVVQWQPDGLFDPNIVYNPETAPRSDVPLNSTFAFEAATGGLDLQEVSLLANSEALRRPLRIALAETLSLLLDDVELLAVFPSLPMVGARRLAVSPSHRFLVAFSVPNPPQWVQSRAEALNLGTEDAREAWTSSLVAVHFIEAMGEVALNRDRPCSLPSPPIDAPLVACEEELLRTPSLGTCTTRCLAPKRPTPVQLACFAGFWSPAGFSCLAPEVQEEATCAVPVGIEDADDPACEGFVETLPPGSACAPRCRSGHVPTEAVLACVGGTLRPPSFRCVKPECPVPTDIPQASANGSCKENYTDGLIPGGRRCTGACADGFRATANLSCLLGRLVPARFSCIDAAIAASGGDAADDFWGSAGGGATLPPTAAPDTTTTEARPTSAAPPEPSFLDTVLGFVESELFIVVTAATGGACLFSCCACGAWALLRRRRRRQASTDKVETNWEEISELAHSFREQEAPSSARSTGSRQSRKMRKAASETSFEAESQATSIMDDQVAGDTFSFDGLEGPEEVKEVLRLITRPTQASEHAAPEEVGDVEDSGAADDDEAERSMPVETPPRTTEEPELIRIAQEAAREAEHEPTPSDLLRFAQRIASEERQASARAAGDVRDARFDAMDRELGEAVAEAAAVSPLRPKSRSSIRQTPSERPAGSLR